MLTTVIVEQANIERSSKIVLSKTYPYASSQLKCGSTNIKDCHIIDPQVQLFDDRRNRKRPDRGSNWEAFHREKFDSMGISFEVKQINQTLSRFRGVLRVLHFQRERPQAKLVGCVSGSALVIIMDTRIESPTFGNTIWTMVDDSNFRMVFAPKGVAHSFVALTRNVVYQYFCDEVYIPNDSYGITPLDSLVQEAIRQYTRHSRRSLQIIAAERDLNYPTLEQALKKKNYLPK